MPVSTGPLHDPVAVVLLHGVGLGPESFADVTSALVGVVVSVPARAGYGPESPQPMGELAAHVNQLLALLGTATPPVRLVAGVSGGATIALAAAIARPHGMPALVLHEPLLGPLAPGLDAHARRAAARLDADAGHGGAQRFLEALAGMALPPVDDARAALIRAEAPSFLAFAPSEDELGTLRGLPIVATVGAESPPVRHQAAAVLAERCGAQILILPGCGHLPQIQAPSLLAGAVRATLMRSDS